MVLVGRAEVQSRAGNRAGPGRHGRGQRVGRGRGGALAGLRSTEWPGLKFRGWGAGAGPRPV